MENNVVKDKEQQRSHASTEMGARFQTPVYPGRNTTNQGSGKIILAVFKEAMSRYLLSF